MKYSILKFSIFLAASGGSMVFADFSFAKDASENKCKSNLGNFKPMYTKGGKKRITERCKNTGEAKKGCESTLNLVEESYKTYNEMIEAGCGKIAEEVGTIVTDPENKTQFDAAIKQNESQISGYKSINAQTDSIIKTLISKSETNIVALKRYQASPPTLPKADNELIKSLEDSHKKGKQDASVLKNFKLTAKEIEKNPQKFKPNISAHAMPATQALELVKALVGSKEEYNALIKAEEEQLAENKFNRDRLNRADTNTPDSSSSGISGFDPSSLLALAPLAAMLAQKPPATPMEDPLGSSITPPTPPERLPSASLVKGEKSGESKKAPLETPTNSSPEITPSPYADAFTGAEDSDSGITKGSSGSGAGGGGSNSVSASGGGGAGGSGSSESGDSKGRSTAALPANAEEALQSFNSGGGLNYAGGGNSSDSTDAPADDSMKDMFNEMEAAVEDSFDSNLEDGTNTQASEIAAEDSDSLFPRVRACHIRALKKGMVLNGLGEKLSELDE